MQTETKHLVTPVIKELHPGKRTIQKLPNNGALVLEHDIPYVLIYRKKPTNNHLSKLVKLGASYLILGSDKEQDIYEFLKSIMEQMSHRFGSFLIFEIFEGEINDREFTVYSSSNKLKSTLKKLLSGLKKIENSHPDQTLEANLGNLDSITSPEGLRFLSNEFRQMGGSWISLKIPPVYKDQNHTLFPVYFKEFRNQFSKVIQKSMFEFIRVQTTSKIDSYHGLGRRRIHEKVLEIDQKIRNIQDQYSFLLLISPINNNDLQRDFFKNKYEKIGKYHYRLLPVDPDILKRKLYNLAIDEIDDPVLAFIYDEKREEIDQELTMLKERGSKNFFYSSIRLYKDVSPELLEEACLILQNIPEDTSTLNNHGIDVQEFSKMAKKEFEFFQQSASDYNGKVHIQNDLNIMMVCNGELFLPSSYKMSEKEAVALLQHEIGTHMLTHYNGLQQPLKQMAYGLAGYDELQEGIAVLAEYLSGSLCSNRLRTLAGRIIAGDALLNGADFTEMFRLLHSTYDFSKNRAYNITSRMFQGGGFLKDIVYLKGLFQLQQYLKNGGKLESLLSGKFALRHLEVIQNLTERKLLVPPAILPRYITNEKYQKKIHTFQQGIPLYKMISL